MAQDNGTLTRQSNDGSVVHELTTLLIEQRAISERLGRVAATVAGWHDPAYELVLRTQAQALKAINDLITVARANELGISPPRLRTWIYENPEVYEPPEPQAETVRQPICQCCNHEHWQHAGKPGHMRCRATCGDGSPCDCKNFQDCTNGSNE